MATCDELKAQLAEALAARHALAIGGQLVSVRYGEKQLTYTPANAGLLSDYIAALSDQVAACSGQEVRNRRRLVYFTPMG